MRDQQAPQHFSLRTAFAEFVALYGWRAYAIPVLTIITIWVLVDVFTSPASSTSAQSGNTVVTQTVTEQVAAEHDHEHGPNPATMTQEIRNKTALPPGDPFTIKGAGKFRVVGTPGAAAGKGEERTIRYITEVEEGIDTSAYGGDDAFAKLVDATLTSVNGWTHDPKFRFEHIELTPGVEPDLRIQLTSVQTTHESCGVSIDMETSCFFGIGNRVIINESRWVRGAGTFEGDLGRYRQYLINHEVGHGIGYGLHEPCGGQGELAPVMMQQTISLSNSELFSIDPNEVYKDDGLVCRANPWPYPLV